MRSRHGAFVLAGVLMGMLSPARGEDRKPQVPDLKVEKYTLPNGLEVILNEDHNMPVVGVNVWYKVGSKNEKRGRTGFAHLFEHLMFQGSEHHDNEYFGPLEKHGAQLNGSTNEDRTNYYETVPRNALELALWLEADRMGFLLPALTQKKLDNQRDVVKNERRQRVDNVPYGQANEKLDQALYPEDHPYHHSVIGSMADLSAASLEDVSAFFRTYYVPNNASLVISGDFEPAQARELVARYFGPIPRGPEVARLTPNVPRLAESKHVTMTDKVTLPMTRLVWPSVPHGHPDERALDVLAAILGQLDKENRLFWALMYNRHVAVNVAAYQQNKMLSGEFGVVLVGAVGQSLDELVKLADAEIERLKKDGVTDNEVRKAQNAEESQLIVGLESTTRKADFLNANNVFDGDPQAYKKDLVELFAVTAADVKRVANTYLTGNRIRVDVTPGAPTPRAPEVAVDPKSQAPLTSPPVVAIKDPFDRSVMPKVGPAPDFKLAPVTRRKLSNGLEVLVSERHTLPILSLQLVIKSGETLVPADRAGLAELTASLREEGTRTRDALTLAGELAEIGATLSSSAGEERSVVGITMLTKHLDRGLELYSDVLLNPSFPEKELVRLKLRTLAGIEARTDSASGIADLVFPRILYGSNHPYSRPIDGVAETVKAITREDVAAFHARTFVPGNAALIVVGDTTADVIAARLEAALKDWKPGDVPHVDLPSIPDAPEGPILYLVDKAAAAQSQLTIGKVGLPRSTPDYFPLLVMNAVLGGQFSSRINLNLREEKGYTYGASSGFQFRLGPGPFAAEAPVQTAVTRDALVEMIKELTDITTNRPPTEAELAFAKDRMILGFPTRFETTRGMASTLADLVAYGLPDDYFGRYTANVAAVTPADAARVARKYLDFKTMSILVVGDRSQIEDSLKSLPFVKGVRRLNAEGVEQ